MNWLKKIWHSSAADKPVDTATAETTSTLESPVTACPAPPISRRENCLPLADLKHFIPLRDLDDSLLVTLPHAILKYPQHTVIFKVDQPSERIFYLLKGTVHMQPVGKYGYLIGENTVRSRLPLNTGRYYGATAEAISNVELLEIPSEFNNLWLEQHASDDGYIELQPIQLPTDLPHKAFFDRCQLAYRDNHLRMPSLPEIAVKLNKSIQSDHDIKEIVEIIHLDPRVVTKLIQVANSPIYATASPIANCHDAVVRLGLNATRNLVLSICMKDLFHTRNRELMKGMRQQWMNCVLLASLCFVLAQESREVAPEDAMLAGLIADIGAIPIMQLAAEADKDTPPFEAIEAALGYFLAPVGARLLRNLDFPQELCNIPQLAENWLYDSGPKLTLADIVILAKLHSYFGSGKAVELPYINTIPAYGKLRNGMLGPDFSLSILHEAQHRIHAAMQLLA